MKQGSSNRRSRSRGGGKRHSGGGKNSNFESNGPEVKIRGSAQQVQEKYLALARDATTAGDRISAEAFFQYAEHYYRIINGDGGNGAGKGAGKGDQRSGRKQSADKAPSPASDGEAEVIDTTAQAIAAAGDPKKAEAETPEGAKPPAESEPAAS